MATMREVFCGVISLWGGTLFFITMKNIITSFFGHREIDASDELVISTRQEIQRVISLGCRTFYFGGYGEFDALCYNIVTQIKKDSPELDIKRVYCVARECYLRKNVRYFNRENYEEVIYLPPKFDGWYKSIYYRNLAIIDRSDHIIFYAENREGSGAYKAYKYAEQKKHANIVNLWK